jgi:peptidoglycan/xylan/chitin deacetylase (PgdA/CDA1 family)
MDYLKANGWQGLSVGQALEFPDGQSVAITFDDGSETDLLAVAPILRQIGFSATFFITAGRLGNKGYLSSEQLRELHSQGFEIGCHSMTHHYLTDLDDAGLQYEICDAKTRLEQIIGRPVEHFSCPGGRCDDRVVSVARSAGYKTLCTSRIHANARKTNLFALGRVAIMRDTSLATFSEICSGSALPRMRSRSIFRAAARQILGNAFYDRLRATLLHR